MKKSLLLITFLFLIFCSSLFAESDIIWTKSIGFNSDSIEAGNIPSGIYYLRIYSEFETMNF